LRFPHVLARARSNASRTGRADTRPSAHGRSLRAVGRAGEAITADHAEPTIRKLKSSRALGTIGQIQNIRALKRIEQIMNIVNPEEAGFSGSGITRIGALMGRLVEERKYAGLTCLVARRGKVAFFESRGHADIEANRPMKNDTIVRIYSMTKPITSVAVLMLMEEGRLRIGDPIAKYIPSFANVKVLSSNPSTPAKLVDPIRPPTICDLLTHTAGLSYGFDDNNLIDRMTNQIVWKAKGDNPDITLAELVDLAASVPLMFQPGTRFQYSLSTDVLGAVVAAASGMPFDAFLEKRVFSPLGMVDTAFHVPTDKIDRFAANYGPDGNGGLKQVDPIDQSHYCKPSNCPSGGGGLVSTAPDYYRFAQMLLNRGELDGVRLLSRKTVEMMTVNHLPAGVTCWDSPGSGFGFGVGMSMNAACLSVPESVGTYGWNGAASTCWWNDPNEGIACIVMAQYMWGDYPIDQDFRIAVFQALD
jgi:CubicO group peptidase (beta-lactamase class C family)